MQMKELISIVAPMYNEEALVSQFCQTVFDALQTIAHRYDIELVLVDDGSDDGTLDQIRRVREQFPDQITIVQLSRNFGLEGAVHAGIRMAAGAAVIVMDADLQDPPNIIPKLVEEWEKGANIVIASRARRPNDGKFKRLSARLFYKILNSLSGKLSLENDAANFRLLDRKAVTALLELPEVNGVFRVSVPYLGMRQVVVPYERDKRFAGETKYQLRSMLRYALNSLTSISIEPLRKIAFATVLSFIMTAVFAVSVAVSEGEWRPALIVCTVVSLLFTLLFLVLSLLAEYLGQVFVEVKGRPSSIIYDFEPCGSATERIKHDSL